MYVRWIIRRHKNASVADASFCDAYLVESYRDERGAPRQRTVCYLGNIRQIGDQFPTIERELFLLRAERILDSTGEVSAADRQAAMSALRQRVPPLNNDEVILAFSENLRWYRRWWEEHGTDLNDIDLLQIIQTARGRVGPV
jgi:hypothetical protein